MEVEQGFAFSGTEKVFELKLLILIGEIYFFDPCPFGHVTKLLFHYGSKLGLGASKKYSSVPVFCPVIILDQKICA